MKKIALLILLCYALLSAENHEEIATHDSATHLRIAPLTGGIHVGSTESGSMVYADVIDSRGRVVHKLEGVEGLNFTFASVTPGVYFMKIKNSSITKSVKIQIP